MQDDPGYDRLDAGGSIAVYRIVQEALVNVEKHARARRVNIHLTWRGGAPVVEVADDGVGGAVVSPDGLGIGMVSMRERAATLRGTLDVGPGVDGRGTRVRVAFPEPS